MDVSSIQAYIEENKSNYTSKYKFNSFFKKSDDVYKFHYYTRDPQLSEINLFLEIQLYDEVLFHFTEEIHDYEKKSLIVDALKRILKVYEKSSISNKEIKACLNKHDLNGLSKYDILIIFYYILYHNGINQKAIDLFYSYYIPHYDYLLKEEKYEACLEELEIIFDALMYETFWTGSVFDYLDQQYYYHLYYIKMIFEKSISTFSASLLIHSGTMTKLFTHLFNYPRFAMCVISIVDDIDLPTGIKTVLLNSVNVNFSGNQEANDALPVRYLKAIFYNDLKQMNELVQEIFYALMGDIIRIQNHDMQIALGTYFLEKYGYELLIKTFAKDYDVHLLIAFEVETIPSEYYPALKEELVKGLYHYAKLVDRPESRVRAIEQITLINRIILSNFKESMYKE